MTKEGANNPPPLIQGERMSKLTIGTHFVSMDEPCLGVAELHLQSPGNKGFHRYQIITVMRNDKAVEMRRDLGSVKKFKKAHQIRIPGGAKDEKTGKFYIEHTVGELVEMAEQLRNNPFPVEELPSIGDGLIQGYYDTMEQKRNKAKGRILIAK